MISIGTSRPQLRDDDFRRIRELLLERSGIELAPGRQTLVQHRLAPRLESLTISRYSDYLRLLADPTSSESAIFLHALTTNVTDLFREPHHFELLRSRVVPEMLRSGNPSLRIWSAGCSTGDEAYSIALTLSDIPELRAARVSILGTEVDSQVLTQARAGEYCAERIARLDERYRCKFEATAKAGYLRIIAELRRSMTFRRANLHGPWPTTAALDVIFCRNVMIYFDLERRERLLRRFADALRPGGHLFLGHSESPSAASTEALRKCGETCYVKL